MAVLVDAGRLDAASALALSSYLVDRFGASVVGVARFDGEYIVVGLYKSLEEGHESVYRRLTGGPSIRVDERGLWVSIVLDRGYDLGVLSRFASCITRFYGVTRLAGRSIVEAYVEDGGFDPSAVVECGREAGVGRLGFSGTSRLVDKMVLRQYSSRFRSSSWRFYRFEEGSALAFMRKGLYYARVSVEVIDGYITGWWLDATFNAAPPMEVYSVLASVKGSPFHELTLFNIDLALRTRVELHGIGVDDFISLVKSLYSRVGTRFYEERVD